MQLVMLAAGFGTRFGGLKQLAPVGPNGEAIMDYTAQSAKACGFDGAVVIVRPEIESQIREHVAANWPSSWPVDYAYQPQIRGTAPAVLAAAPYVEGVFAVANADDLYGEALALITSYFREHNRTEDPHLLVAYQLARTVLGASEVKRGLCEVSAIGELDRVAEHLISIHDRAHYEAVPIGKRANANEQSAPRPLTGEESVSMNLWGFRERIFRSLETAIAAHVDAGRADEELLLPDVVEDLVEQGADSVSVVVTDDQCIGITHQDDLELVREQLARR